MATGWARDGAVQDQIDASVEEAVELARSRLPKGESLTHCEECGLDIPEARRKAIVGVRLCVGCQQQLDQQQASQDGVNRRASKGASIGCGLKLANTFSRLAASPVSLFNTPKRTNRSITLLRAASARFG